MKKSLLTISLLASFSTILNATNFDTKISIGATSAKINDKSYTQFGLGYTANTRLNNDILLGFGNSLSYGNVSSNVDVYTADMDLRV